VPESAKKCQKVPEGLRNRLIIKHIKNLCQVCGAATMPQLHNYHVTIMPAVMPAQNCAAEVIVLDCTAANSKQIYITLIFFI